MSKNSANIVVLAGCRFAGSPSYVPSYVKAGETKPVSAKAEFNVYQNKGDKKMKFKITAWGKMADSIARGGAPGKEICIFAEVQSFEAKVWMPQPDGSSQFITKADGTPLTTVKVGFTIQDIVWGGDSAKLIADEIQVGARPPMWNQPGSPDHATWRQTLATRNGGQFQVGMTQFGYAKVNVQNVPQGAQIVVGQVANNAVQYQANPGMVQNTLPIQPAVQPAVNPQVQVNGTNMGYAMPATQPAVPSNNGYVMPTQGQVQTQVPAQAPIVNGGYAAVM